MANPIVTVIDRAGKAVWPTVQAGVSQTHRSMLELSGVAEEVVPKVEEWVARGDGAPMRRRRISEETIWVLASMGWLRTGPERDVILAAKAYTDAISEDDAPGTDMHIEYTEDELIRLVGTLPEYMTTPNTKES